MLVKDFDYDLPQELIAQYPMEPRDHSRLMIVDKKNGNIDHKHFYDFLEYVNPGDVLVFNDTRVMPARLHGLKDTGARVEVLLLSRIDNHDWEVLVRPGKKLLIGAKIIFSEKLSCEVIKTTEFGGRIVRFAFEGVFEEILDELGEMPLPPYITAKLEDKERYQTVYSKEQGSAAAPTAGLHFTKELLSKIAERGAEEVFITLNVGLGTFRPVSVDDISEHVMHRETYHVSEQSAQKINTAKREGRRIIAIGTTAVRTLEAAGSTGVLKSGLDSTNIFIYPGYEFRFVDALITNFHLPQSTLLMLVSTLASREIMFKAYQQAIEEKYRFFSFGDAMFIK